jgi:hypothetical protein
MPFCRFSPFSSKSKKNSPQAGGAVLLFKKKHSIFKKKEPKKILDYLFLSVKITVRKKILSDRKKNFFLVSSFNV